MEPNGRTPLAHPGRRPSPRKPPGPSARAGVPRLRGGRASCRSPLVPQSTGMSRSLLRHGPVPRKTKEYVVVRITSVLDWYERTTPGWDEEVGSAGHTIFVVTLNAPAAMRRQGSSSTCDIPTSPRRRTRGELGASAPSSCAIRQSRDLSERLLWSCARMKLVHAHHARPPHGHRDGPSRTTSAAPAKRSGPRRAVRGTPRRRPPPCCAPHGTGIVRSWTRRPHPRRPRADRSPPSFWTWATSCTPGRPSAPWRAVCLRRSGTSSAQALTSTPSTPAPMPVMPWTTFLPTWSPLIPTAPTGRASSASTGSTSRTRSPALCPAWCHLSTISSPREHPCTP